MKNNRKVLYGLVALALLLSVVGISVGFASLSQDLEIKGTAEVVPASWNILFKNLGAANEIEDGEEITAPQLSTTSTKIENFDVRLTKPGDAVTYKFKVANDGTINAKLSDIQIATPTFEGQAADATAKASDEAIVQQYFEYTLQYDNGENPATDLSLNDTLNANSSKDLILTIKYKDDAEALPTDTVEVKNLSITLTYTQAN